MKRILSLAIALILAGCVNLHVHFPEAAGRPAAPAPAGAAQ
jgi:cytosine/adenosine deaminase-related metal-dependent hydrolase